MQDFTTAVLRVLAGIPSGVVMSYGEVAAEAGYPGAARAVGNLLQSTGVDVPWWRVVTAAGRLVPGHERDQTARLRAEGVRVRDGRVSGMGSARRGRRGADHVAAIRRREADRRGERS